ncbi:hypothetical protein HPB48_016804 [Haemaphysalis longicornis]|uniref:Uncharacterized protein n=1 Tax=Haemaphysalis longicornis TaxID=44386 RepID=A0A9J6GPX6_HAELO|nr:hypothetical protein HPB48_016804 [Haemaphysalis longicornis]
MAAAAGVCGGGSMLGVPGPDSYFTPISPALPQQQQQLSPPPVHRDGPSSKNILDILMDANINVEAHMLNGDAAKSAQLRQHVFRKVAYEPLIGQTVRETSPAYRVSDWVAR